MASSLNHKNTVQLWLRRSGKHFSIIEPTVVFTICPIFSNILHNPAIRWMFVSSPQDVFCFSPTPLIDCKDLSAPVTIFSLLKMFIVSKCILAKSIACRIWTRRLFTDWCTNWWRRSGHRASRAHFLSISDTFFKNYSSEAFHLSLCFRQEHSLLLLLFQTAEAVGAVRLWRSFV